MSLSPASGQSRIAQAFARRKALIAYLTIGYPQKETALELVPRLEEWGVDIVELGVPFSDPLADGATIQEASYQALRQGVTTQFCLETAFQLRQHVSLPLLFMTYYNLLLNPGPDEFCRQAEVAGADGLIIPDLTPDEGTELETASQKHKLDLVYLLAPNSPEERLRLVARRSRGFIYLVSLTGVTGPRDTLPPGLEEFVLRVRPLGSLPLAVGFGIAGPEQAQRAARIADGVIVGSRLLQLVKEDSTFRKAKKFIQGLRQALDRAFTEAA